VNHQHQHHQHHHHIIIIIIIIIIITIMRHVTCPCDMPRWYCGASSTRSGHHVCDVGVGGDEDRPVVQRVMAW